MSAINDGDHFWTPFDPLLRDLLSFGLVEADEADGARAWRLTETACGRLTRLATPPPPEDKVVYFSRRCARCGEHRPTRRRPGGFVCDKCSPEPAVHDAPDRAAVNGAAVNGAAVSGVDRNGVDRNGAGMNGLAALKGMTA